MSDLARDSSLIVMNLRIALTLSAFAAVAATASAASYDLVTDFSTANGNPNGVWSYGEFTGPLTTTFTPYATAMNNPFGPGWFGASDIELNTTGSAGFGIAQGGISLDSDTGTPVARFTAPFTGTYTFSVAVGGDLGLESNPLGTGSGNANASLSGLRLAGVDLAADSFTSNVKSFSGTLTLVAGTTLDAYVGAHYGAGNTNTSFTVTGQPVPEPSAIAALGVGAVALLRRRKRA